MNAMEGFGTVHDRHTLIHQNQIIRNFPGGFDRFLSADSRVDPDLCLFQEAYRYREIHTCVIHNQDMGIRRAKTLMICRSFQNILFEFGLEISNRANGYNFLRNVNDKLRASPVNAFHMNIAIHHGKQLLRDGKPEPGSLDSACLFQIDSFKFGKEFVKVFFADPHAGIFDRNRQCEKIPRFPRFSISTDNQPNAALVGILDGIVQQVGDDLPDTDFITVQAVRDGFIQINLVECVGDDDWYYAGYYTDYGYEANYDIYDLSGWGPDYGDPSTYLDTFLPDYAGYMIKCIGIF